MPKGRKRTQVSDTVSRVPVVPAKHGRPSIYSDELVDEICERISKGEMLGPVCDSLGMSRGTFIDWTNRNASVNDRYADARRKGYDRIAEDCIRIADNQDLDPNSRRVMVDTRKWLLSKLRPTVYGDRTTVDVQATVNTGNTLSIQHLTDSQLSQIQAMLEASISHSASAGLIAASTGDATVIDAEST